MQKAARSAGLHASVAEHAKEEKKTERVSKERSVRGCAPHVPEDDGKLPADVRLTVMAESRG